MGLIVLRRPDKSQGLSSRFCLVSLAAGYEEVGRNLHHRNWRSLPAYQVCQPLQIPLHKTLVQRGRCKYPRNHNLSLLLILRGEHYLCPEKTWDCRWFEYG